MVVAVCAAAPTEALQGVRMVVEVCAAALTEALKGCAWWLQCVLQHPQKLSRGTKNVYDT